MSLDYFFMTKAGIKLREELDYSLDDDGHRKLAEARARGELVKCLALKCSSTKIVMAHVVPWCYPSAVNPDILCEVQNLL